MNPILVTGAAGFIGFTLTRQLLERGETVVGVDNLNHYYDPELKRARLSLLEANDRFSAICVDVADTPSIMKLFADVRARRVVHLAAQAGVRYSLTNPHSYIQSNLVGFTNILEGCRHGEVEHLVYASSSSVYGANRKMPFSVSDSVDHPVSLYAATKKANELMAHSYSHLYGLPTTGLRFFTVYGPWGRPDMALFLFTQAILEGRPIQVFNGGDMERDFTYVDDVVDGIIRVMDRLPDAADPTNVCDLDASHGTGPYRIYNIGSHRPVPLLRMIDILEESLGRKAERQLLPMQPGDVRATYADVDALKEDIGFSPSTTVEVGIPRFVEWYREYYGV